MDSLEKRVRMFFSQCRRNELQQSQADNEFTTLRRDHYKVLEDADEKVQLASQMYDLVERYLRRLDSELHKFKCELEADHNGITEILEKRSLELDGNSSSNSNSIMNNLLGSSGANYNSQKENRYFGSISSSGAGSNSHSNSHGGGGGGLMRDRDSHRYNRHKAEKRRDSNNGPSSLSGGPPEKRQMLSNSSAAQTHSSSGISSGGSSSSAGAHSSAGGGHGGNSGGHSSLPARSAGSSNQIYHFSGGNSGSATTGGTTSGGNHSVAVAHTSSNSGGASSSSSVPSLSHQNSSNVSHSTVNPVIVTTTLGTGANAVSLGTTSYTAESEVMRAASQAIAMTQQMQQGRRTASLKASVEAATSGGVGGGPGKDLLGRELVGATHNAIQAVERESFNSSNQRRHKK